ncbi:MAG: DUF4625 domain-containing protein [Dyadobacter fermentans]
MIKRLIKWRQFARLSALLILTAPAFIACDKDEAGVEADSDKPKPTIDNVEIGLNNNEVGVIGSDFHFNVDIVAADKIDIVEVKIVQREGETYAKKWGYEKKWEQHKGAKNTNIHSHFDIPVDATDGIYDFWIIVHDMNGAKLEEKRKITLWSADKLPVNPQVYVFNTFLNGDINATTVKKGEKLFMISRLTGVKDDGKMYMLLINKKHNHRPETVSAIDFNKAIVYDMREHKGIANTSEFVNMDPPGDFLIGAAKDPKGTAISGDKAWESGTYYLAMVYTNTTHNMSTFQYKEIKIDMN